MRHGFTLIELMIVIAIIAIIAAIAIPNLLESRITANEAQAASSLKAGIFPGQVQFQGGGYTDIDGDGRGCYANHVASMAGGVVPATLEALNFGPPKPLALLDPKYANNSGKGGHQVVGYLSNSVTNYTSNSSANVGAYDYYMHTDIANLNEDNCESYFGAYDYYMHTDIANLNEDNCESYFGATACPHKNDGSEARRAFGMNCAGTVLQTKQTVTNANASLIAYVGANSTGVIAATSIYSTSPVSGIPSPNTANGAPYQK